MDGQVVHIDQHPSLGDLSTKDHVHHHLKGSGGIGQSEEHNRRFEEPFRGEECCLPLVSLFDVDVVVSPPYIEFSKEGATSESVDGLRNEWRYITIFLGPTVNRTVVLNWAEFSVFL